MHALVCVTNSSAYAVDLTGISSTVTRADLPAATAR